MTNISIALTGLVAAGISVQAAGYTIHSFKKVQLTDQFWSEGAYFGDFNKDGKMDVVSGPFWYAGPDYTKRYTYRAADKTSKIKKADGSEATVPGYKGGLGTENDYSDCFLTYTYDFNNDGYTDILIYGFPGKEVFWYENILGQPGGDSKKEWPAHKVIDVLDNESPMFGDVTGDGKPEIICNSGGYLGYGTFNWKDIKQPGRFIAISPKGSWQRYSHGIGFGDVNGDGRVDILEQNSWWEQPKSLEGDPMWIKHEFPFAPGPGAAQMQVYDFNKDGLNDVLTTLNPHGFGLVWYEQTRESGKDQFKKHVIMDRTAKDNKYGVKFTQPHAIELVDMDKDGILDVLVGKRFWAHGPTGDDEPSAPAVLYWFRTVRNKDKTVDFVPHLIDDNSGVGTQVAFGDMNGDKWMDVIVGNKKGSFVFLHEAKKASKAEWTEAQPKPQ